MWCICFKVYARTFFNIQRRYSVRCNKKSTWDTCNFYQAFFFSNQEYLFVWYLIFFFFIFQGPEVRSGDLPQPIMLESGQEFTFTIKRGVGTSDCVSVNYDDFVNDIEVGDMLLVDGIIITWSIKTFKLHITLCYAYGLILWTSMILSNMQCWYFSKENMLGCTKCSFVILFWKMWNSFWWKANFAYCLMLL